MSKHLVVRVLFFLSGVLLIGCSSGAAAPPPTATLSPEMVAGKAVFTRHCASCHLLSKDDVKVGPSLHNIANRGNSRVANQDAETYILTSIMNPSAYLVDGYEDLMPKSLGKSMTGEEIDQVVAYLLTLEEKN